MKLFSRESGSGDPLIILHGLFGSSDNWFTLAKTFSDHYHVYLVDLRNHGQSPHDDEFNYAALVKDLHQFFEDQNIDKADLIGHSLGGKTVMNFVLEHPELVQKQIVVDITPRFYPVHHDTILEGLNAIDPSSLQSRNEADELLTKYISEFGVRQFLLKNLTRDENGKFTWKFNLKVLGENIHTVGEEIKSGKSFKGESLFIKGTKSNYFESGDEEKILSLFPNSQFVALETGHWVQAEKPKEFSEKVLDFLKH